MEKRPPADCGKIFRILFRKFSSRHRSTLLYCHSTCTSLLECLNDVTLNIQDKCQTIVIYIDFSKAFDVVPHDKLFTNLHVYGICAVSLQWIKTLTSFVSMVCNYLLFALTVTLLVTGVLKFCRLPWCSKSRGFVSNRWATCYTWCKMCVLLCVEIGLRYFPMVHNPKLECLSIFRFFFDTLRTASLT